MNQQIINLSNQQKGGYLLDCHAIESGSNETNPACDNGSIVNPSNLWCNEDNSCYGQNRITTCTGGWASTTVDNFSCSGCKNGYYNCDTSNDSCEIHDGSPCTTTENLPGVYSGCNGAPGAGVGGFCVPNRSNFVTGITSTYLTSDALLSGVQLGTGDLIKFSKNNISTNTFIVKNDGSVGIGTDSFDSNVAALVVSSTSKGILIPRLTVSQRNAIGAAPEGLLLYNMDDHEFNYYNGSVWESVGKTYSASSTGGLNLSGTSFSANIDNLTIEISGSNQLKVKYDPVFFATSTNGLTFLFDAGSFSTSTPPFSLLDIPTITAGEYGSSTQAIVLSIDTKGRVVAIATSTINIFVDNIIDKNILARRNEANTFASPTIFNASTTFNATTTHNAGVRANLYCDSSGNNCFDLNVMGWNLPVTSITTTPGSYDGFISSTPKTGYNAANYICSSTYPGYHFCRTDEIINYIQRIGISNFGTFGNFGWVAEGPPGFTAYSNDCNGYTTSSPSYLGAYWHFRTDGGAGWLLNCGDSRPIACCK